MSVEYVPKAGGRKFFIPPTLADDFTRFLNTDVPNMVMDFKIYKDWYDQFNEDYEEQTIRGEIYPDATKSRYTNTDNNLNFRAAVDSGIRKGDMLVDPHGTVYLLDWAVLLEHNNAPSRACRCTAALTFKRNVAETVDERGYLIEPEGTKIIADRMPANAYFYDGRPEWSAASGGAGLVPNATVVCEIQLNDKTKEIVIGDKFIWGNSEYVVVELGYAGCDLDLTCGVIAMRAKKTSGGELE